ncbi:MAG: glycosyltransferase [Sideroxyarcus sp.]|nr:glycosyltransferase [Sideroxyarcus sp.]
MEETSPHLPGVRILAVCATYNRREVTLAGLRSLNSQQLPANAILQLAVVDDNSTDGTIDAVRQEFPAALTLKSIGGLYWAGAMRFGFSHFWDKEKYSHLLVFNDDCVFYPNAVKKLIEVTESVNAAHGAVAVASLRDKFTGDLTYGGMKRRRWRPAIYLDRVIPSGDIQVVDTLNMNLALISGKCLERNELIREGFSHSLADFDFGLRASRNGAKVYLAPGFLGECSRNQTQGTWEDGNVSLRRRWSLICQPKGLPLKPRYIYLKSHSPFIWPAIFVWPYVRLCISYLLIRARQLVNRGAAFLR